MSDTTARGGPNWGLLLLIPAVVIVAKAAMHRRAMWESGYGPAGPGGRGYGHHHRFRGGDGPDFEQSGFRLPPKIERTLDAWHTRAHTSDSGTTAPSGTSDVDKASDRGDALDA